ncbi:hypothetical protein [Amedibacillus sp. YH-ame10]
MKDVFSSYKGIWKNDELSEIVCGIQECGGEILSISTSLSNVSTVAAERLLIMYEDNNKREDIKKFLSGKEDKYKQRLFGK